MSPPLRSERIHFDFIEAAISASRVFSLIGFFRMVASPSRCASHRTTQAQIRHDTCSAFFLLSSLSRWKDLFVLFEGRGLTKANAKEKKQKLLCLRMDDNFLSVSNLASTFISLGRKKYED